MTSPISICLFTSTKGHWGHTDVYKTTLDHLDRQIPLGDFGARYAHIKISPGEEALGEQISTALSRRGFFVEKTVGAWKRGAVHGQQYLLDQIKASQSPVLHRCPYMLFLEDDWVMNPHRANLRDTLSQMLSVLAHEPSVVSFRFLSATNLSSSPMLKKENDVFWSPDFNYQPALLRTRDFYVACKFIEDNWNQLKDGHCEMVTKIALNILSRSEYRHLVWLPHYAEVHHLGEQNFEELKSKYLR